MDVEDFKRYCIELNAEIVVQKFIIDSKSHFFENIMVNQEFEFKKHISNVLDVHLRDIVIAGSGKLGFSIKPETGGSGLYLYKSFDEGRTSDLDIAIVNSSLFDQQLKKLYDYTASYTVNNWRNKTDRNSFAKYILKGRIATRFLPIDFVLAKELEELQIKYKMKFKRDINFEIYKSWYFFETYHKENIKSIQVNLIR